VPLHEGDAHPVYIDFIDTLTILGNILSEVDELHQIGADTPLMDIEEASQKLRRISNAWKERVTELEQENAFYEVMLNKHTYRVCIYQNSFVFVDHNRSIIRLTCRRRKIKNSVDK